MKHWNMIWMMNKLLHKLLCLIYSYKYKEGDTVYWHCTYIPEFKGEYVVIKERDNKGNLVIYNDSTYYRNVPYYEVTPIK